MTTQQAPGTHEAWTGSGDAAPAPEAVAGTGPAAPGALGGAAAGSAPSSGASSSGAGSDWPGWALPQLRRAASIAAGAPGGASVAAHLYREWFAPVVGPGRSSR